MNRRHFFGMTAAALIGAGLPLSLLPERSIFLPPREGWYPSDFVMREVIQYNIGADCFAVRHDVPFERDGIPIQPWTLAYLSPSAVKTERIIPLNAPDMKVPDMHTFDDEVLRMLRRNAREKFAQMAFNAGFDAPRKLLPLPDCNLPYGVENARYV